MKQHDADHHSPSQAKFSVGLTGGIGSGKTTVADMFAKLGASVIDTDAIAHQLSAAGGIAITPIIAEFGADFIDASGAMDRARMRALVFSDSDARHRLESILHPLIRTETARAAEQAEGPYLIFVVPLLIESGNWKRRVERILAVDCDEQVQVQRVMQRNAMSESQVRAIMATQASRQQRLQAADDVIVNDGDPAALLPQVAQLHTRYLSFARLL
ncbi:dephospho-CoA kinase [Collimonas arenae]|uniref:Dephospho-CoA kinase n=1 Tax=Collimonas arenae TaxID=279058 RepID=A0A127QNR2_9BURK|nr:dephospho-CoA kinase [Collimonas arenae]AMP01781.1 dephospho-CoA kinase [Collimonas arenae]AMP11681.1 dephospho-CoA kinase [Collimonas arenae]